MEDDRKTARSRGLAVQRGSAGQSGTITAIAALSPSRQAQVVNTIKEIAEMKGAADLDAAPLLDIPPPQQGGSG